MLHLLCSLLAGTICRHLIHHACCWPSQQHAQVCLVLCIPFGCALSFVPGIVSIPFWKPLTCGYVARGCFFQKKRAPHLWKPLTCGYVAQGWFSQNSVCTEGVLAECNKISMNVSRSSLIHFDQKKTVLGDPCSRLA